MNRTLFLNYRKLFPRNIFLLCCFSALAFLNVLILYRQWNVYTTATLLVIINSIARLAKEDTLSRYRAFQRRVEDELMSTARKQLSLNVKETPQIESSTEQENDLVVITNMIKAFNLPLTLINTKQDGRDLVLTFTCTDTEQLSENQNAFLLQLKSRLSLSNPPILTQNSGNYNLIIDLERKA